MKIILLANNWVGWKVSEYLREQKETVVALGIHEKEKQKFVKEIIRTVQPPRNFIFTANSLKNNSTVKKLEILKSDFIISAFWGYILSPEVIALPKFGCINFHPAYLPWNRGVNPNVWPFIDGTPAGVTIHYIDEGTDTGDIIARKKVPIVPYDTAGTLYNKTLKEIVSLFKVEWPRIRAGKVKRIKQSRLKRGTHHWRKDVSALDQIDLKKKYTGKEIIDRLRARSYPDRFYANYIEKGEKVYIRVELSHKEK